MALILTPTVQPADKSGVTPNTISLPSGPGSIEGLGEAFQPALNTGTARYGVGLDLPPGTAGHAPSLSLRYEGGAGNGPLGFGWSLPIAFIQRQCDKGIPRYVDDDNQLDDDRDDEVDEVDERDVFINEMKEELVPQANGDFFCENESAFIRYRRLGEHWEGTLPNGTRLEFGLSADGRVGDAASGRVFRWWLERSTDTHGNTILYSYRSFPGDSNHNQKYLDAVRYGPGSPAPTTPPWANFHFAKFIYQDRSDWFEDCRSGFVVRTGARLREIVVGTQGPTLTGHAAGDFDGDGITDHLNRRYRLSYLDYAGTNTHWSLLSEILQIGADDATSLPPATFDYAVCNPPDLISASGQAVGGDHEPRFVMDNPLADLVDLNGDGLPDLLKTEAGGGAHTGFLNLGEVRLDGARAIQWDSPREVASADGLAWNVDLQSPNNTAHLADMDGDGMADLAYKSSVGDVFYFANDTRLSWSPRRFMSSQDFAPPAPFGDPNVRTADVDFDKRIDIIQSLDVGDGAEYRVWFNLGEQRYARSLTVPQSSGFLFSQPGVHIVDFNGDRVPDLAQVGVTRVVVTAGLGYGRFADPIIVPIPDPGLEDEQVATARLQDVTGNGLPDLVLERATPGQLWYWLNLGNYTFTSRKIITGMPSGLGANPTIRWADLNGNGTTDLIYADSQSIPRLQTVDLGELLGCAPAPNVLTRVANGIGRVTTIEYQPSTRFAQEDATEGRPWPDPMPFPVSVVSAVVTADSLGHEYVTRFRYHDGYYDGREKEFRGFARVEQTDVGDATAPTLITRSYFDTGRQHEALKGKTLRQTAEQEDGGVFWDETTTWTRPPRTLMTGVNGQAVAFAHPTASSRRIIELAQGEERVVESEFAYDAFGNQTTNANYGIVLDGDRSAFDDERITTTEFAINTDAWLLRFPSRTQIQDEHGAVTSRTETFYDDSTFSGDNFGEIMKGDVTLTRDWIYPRQIDAFVDTARVRYDSLGNPVLDLDPLAQVENGVVDFNSGHAREAHYDTRFHTYPEEELIHVGQSTPPLIARAEYDEGFATVQRSIDFNSQSTTFAYDEFARLTRIIRPGDTELYPTEEHDYVLAEPFAVGRVVNYVESRLLDKQPGSVPDRRGHYYISRQYTDGLGRSLMFKHEAERDESTGNPRVAVKEAVSFNARMAVSRVLHPFYSTVPGEDLDALLAFEDIHSEGWRGEFFENGHPAVLTLAAAQVTSTDYDATIRPLKVTHPDGASRASVYEPLLTQDYDENDLDTQSPAFATPRIRVTDGLGRHIRTDEIVRLNDDGTEATESVTWRTFYQYDLNDRLVSVTDSQQNVKTMSYDGLQRLLLSNDPDRGTKRYIYDQASNLIELIDAKNQRTTYTYDGVNRMLTEDYHDENESFSSGFVYDPLLPLTASNRPDVAYFYDVPMEAQSRDGPEAARNTKGMLSTVWDLAGQEHNSYDARTRLEWTEKRVREPGQEHLTDYRTSFAHDSADRLVRVTYPDNDEVSYEYNDRNLAERVKGGPTGLIISNYDYVPAELKQRIEYGNGVETVLHYDRRLRLNSLLTVGTLDPNSQERLELAHFQYEYDPVSNIRAIRDQRPGSVVSGGEARRNTQLFRYDDLYRLTRAQYSFNEPDQPVRDDGTVHYRYDRIGNMLEKTSDLLQFRDGFSITDPGTMVCGGAAGTWRRAGGATSAPGPHALTEIRHPEREPRSCDYDANGNMTRIDQLLCTWDFKNRLVTTETPSLKAEYIYDHTDRRIVKRVTPKADNGGQRPSSVLYVGKHFEVRDHAQPTKYVWVGATRVARVTGSLSSNQRIQRLKIAPGWNLASLGVSSTNTVQQLRDTEPSRGNVIKTIHRWRPSSGDYAQVNDDDDLPAGTVLWLEASQGCTLSLVGSYIDPAATEIASGAGYYSGTGLEAWELSASIPDDLTVWTFASEEQTWRTCLPGDLRHVARRLNVLEPGSAFFANAEAPELLHPPDPRLRILFYQQDHLASSGQVTDVRGHLVQEMTFYPFGGQRTSFENMGRNEEYGFNQKEHDRESGLQYFEARYLAGHLGRFTSCDPLNTSSAPERLADPQRSHPYSYAGNNPLARLDPLGLDWTWPTWEDVTDVGTAAGGYLVDTAQSTYNYVVENPGKTALAIIVPAPISATVSAVTTAWGVGRTSYEATENLIEGVVGDDFDAGSYHSLNANERKEKIGKGAGGVIVVAATIAASRGPRTSSASKGSTVKTTHSRTTRVADTVRGMNTAARDEARRQLMERLQKKQEWIRNTRDLRLEMEMESGRVDGGMPVIREIWKRADEKFGPGW